MGKKDKEIKRLLKANENLRRMHKELLEDLRALRRGTTAEKIATEIKHNLKDRVEDLAMKGASEGTGTGFADLFKKYNDRFKKYDELAPCFEVVPDNGPVASMTLTANPEHGVKGIALSSIEDKKPDRISLKEVDSEKNYLRIASDSWQQEADRAGKNLHTYMEETLHARAVYFGYNGINPETFVYDGTAAIALLV
jgi:hypothetical protein